MSETFNSLLPVMVVFLMVWLLGLSVWMWWLYNHYRKLGKGVRGGNLIKVLESVLESQKDFKKELDKFEKQTQDISLTMKNHIQKVGLTRFNPFNETGGDQSFSLCLLDDNDHGFIISCLHTRDRTRVYAKPVKSGKSKYRLSDEEKKAISEALKK